MTSALSLELALRSFNTEISTSLASDSFTLQNNKHIPDSNMGQGSQSPN